MSLMRINYVRSELKKLTAVIINLIENYDKNFKEYDSRFHDIERKFSERELNAHEIQDHEVLSEIITEKGIYTKPLQDLRSLAIFQNELMLVKHVALVENMIVQLFHCLTCLLQNFEYRNKYFVDIDNFSDSYEAAGKISELTDKKINLKKMKFWDLYETLKTIRNTVAHGDPLFVITYRRFISFNNEINIIHLHGEKNKCKNTKNIFPILINPTYERKSEWFCCLKSDLNGLIELNNKCLQFVEDVRGVYLEYGKENKFSEDELYGCKSIIREGMKINHYNSSHKGHLPVRVLQHNIIAQFERTTSSFLTETKKAIKEKGLKAEFGYTVNVSSSTGEKVKGPFVYNESKEINLHESFLAYLWCVTYSLYIYTDMIILETIDTDTQRKELANKTFAYALSLIKDYKDWDKNTIPNPEVYDVSQAADIERVNILFLYGFNFVMCHEYFHVDLGHCNAVASTKDSLTDLEKKEFELEADANAVNLLMNGICSGNEAATKNGVAIALSSLLFFSSTLSNGIHPDSDVRISNAFDQLCIDDNDKAWLIACAAISLWANQYSIELTWKDSISFKELFKYLSVQLD